LCRKIKQAVASKLFVRAAESADNLGHIGVETTMIYIHVMRGLASTAVSPLGSFSDQVGNSIRKTEYPISNPTSLRSYERAGTEYPTDEGKAKGSSEVLKC
jgi:hypothetical protein